MSVLDANALSQGRQAKRLIFRLLSMFVMLSFLSSCSEERQQTAEILQSDHSKQETAVEHAVSHLETRYVCSMHPKIIKSKPG